MGSRWILAVTSCLLVLSGCGIGRSADRPQSYGQFEKTLPIIRDTVTGLEWLVGPDEDMTWDDAKTWVDRLGGTWRMPTRAELRGLWDAGISRDNWGPFVNSGWDVWSGEVEGSEKAWGFTFVDAYQDGCHLLTYYIDSRAFAVRPR